MRLNEVELRRLTPEQRARLTDFETVFGTPGWQRLKREVLERAIQIRNNAINHSNERDLYFAKGQAAALAVLANYDKAVEAEFQNSLMEWDEKAQDAADERGSNA